MKIKLSSFVTTCIFKFIFPAIWILGFGKATVSLFLCDNSEKWKFLLTWIIGTGFLSTLFSLKLVKIDKDKLIVSNFISEDKISISEISKVTENKMININPVWIHFKNSTKFGTKIKFIPTPKISFLSSHPVVNQLRKLRDDAERRSR